MLRGEEPRRWPTAVFLGVVAAVAVAAMLWAAERYDSALVDVEPPAFVHQAELDAAELRIAALEVGAEVASQEAIALQAQIAAQKLALEAQAAELAALKAALAAAQKARATHQQRPRKADSDPPASSYIRLN